MWNKEKEKNGPTKHLNVTHISKLLGVLKQLPCTQATDKLTSQT